VRQLSLDFAPEMAKYGAARLYLRAELAIGGKTVSRQMACLTAPRYLELKKARVRVALSKTAPRRYLLTLTSAVLQPATAFDLPGLRYRAEDNFINLYPGEPRHIELRTEQDLPTATLRRKLEVTSLVDTYS